MRTKRVTVQQFKKLLEAKESTENVIVCKAGITSISKELDPETGLREWTISLPSVDRESDTISVVGWKISDYRKNPVVLWAHDQSALPIGKSVKVWKDGSDALKAIPEFAVEENPFARTVAAMIENGFLNAASVGFQPLEFEPSTDETRDGYFPVDFKKQELLEWSVVPVPAHAGALADAKSLGIDLAPMVDWAEQVLDSGETGMVLVPRETIETLHKSIAGEKCYSCPGESLADEESVSESKAISFDDVHGGKPYPVGEKHCAALDYTGEIDKDQGAWFDAETEEVGFMHHDNEGLLVWESVAQQMAALLCDYPDMDDQEKEIIYNHLSLHYNDFEHQAPELKDWDYENLRSFHANGEINDPECLPTFASEENSENDTVVSESGDEVFEDFEKAIIDVAAVFRQGRIVSSANENRLRRAQELLAEVLSQLEQSDPVDDEKKLDLDDSATQDWISSLVRGALNECFKLTTGQAG